MNVQPTSLAAYADLRSSLNHREWRPVLGFEGYYDVSSDGQVRRLVAYTNTYPGKILRPAGKPDWYPTVSLHAGEKVWTGCVHSLVAEAFLGPRQPGMHVNHKNGVKRDNRVENLEWVTPAENNRHAQRTGLNPMKGADNPAAKLTAQQVMEIRRRYQPRLGENGSKLRKEFGISNAHMSEIVRGASWTHLPTIPFEDLTVPERIARAVATFDGPFTYEQLHDAMTAAGYQQKAAERLPVLRTLVCRMLKSGELRRIRRGLFIESSLFAKGLVEHPVVKQRCSITGKLAFTWRVVQPRSLF